MRATPREEIETRANVFSAGLLTPLDNFRRQIPDGDKVDLDMISHCATISLLLLENQFSYTQLNREPESNVYDRFASQR
jgi:Zn-dependent peptidase ImmA (M78 family)